MKKIFDYLFNKKPVYRIQERGNHVFFVQRLHKWSITWVDCCVLDNEAQARHNINTRIDRWQDEHNQELVIRTIKV